MTPAMKKCVRETDAPVSFSTGGGARPGNHTVGFEGSSIIGDEQVYVLDSCPPAQSIGKAVLAGGFLFVWGPRNHVPYWFGRRMPLVASSRFPVMLGLMLSELCM